MSYVSLHTHTSKGSLLDGMGLTDDYCEYAAELGMTHLGISDHGTVDNYIEFQNSCKKHGLIPIFGIEFYIVPDIRESKKGEQRSHILAFAKNETGFQNICRMVSISNIEGFYRKPRISPGVLLNHSEGLIITTGCSASPLFHEYGLKLFEELLVSNPGDIYLEVMPHTHKEQYEINEICKQLSHQYNVKIIATNDSHYVKKNDAKAHEVLLAVGTKKKWSDPARWSFNGSDFYLRSRRDMVQAFVAQGQFEREEIDLFLLNTMEIAEKCSDFQWIKGKPLSLPAIKTKSVQSDYEFLTVLCEEGFERLVTPELDAMSYKERLEEELSLIKEKKFERYFLIVWDLIKWCQEEGIMTGPGRGSSSGSLVCYLLGITKIDPIRHGLLFFRFLSPDRIDLPDVDSDFSDIDRPRVRKHLEELYGADNVASVSTYSVLRGRGAVRDVSRVFDVPLKRVNEVCLVIEKKIGEDEGNEHTIENALLSFEDGQKFYEEFSEVSDIAIKLEGQYRNRGVHASALVITDEDLTKGTRCSLVLGKEKEHVINWDKNTIEYFGLVKLDVLGLKMLTVLNYCRKLIKENHGIDIDYNRIPLNDEKYYAEFSKGNTVGCFQLGSVNMRKFCRQLGLDNFETLVAATALYRPGPLGGGATELYIKRKNGEETVPSLHPILDEITKDTYGVIIYQEQLMLIMHLLAGMEWSVVDKVRKLVAKSKGAEALQKYEEQFVNGCKENKTISEEMAHSLWNDLLSFGAYGFNKSHACSYSHLTVWDIFLKLNYPAEFMTALLTYGTDNKDEQEEYIREAFRLGLDIRPPKVGISDATVWTIHEGRLYAPFIEIVGVGNKTAASFQKLGKKKGFIIGDKTLSQRFIDILEKIDAYNDTPLSDIEADRVSQFLGFSLVKNKLYKYKKLYSLLSKDITFSEVKSINIKETDNNIRYYFGLVTELNLSTRNGANGKYTVANATFRDDTGDCKIGFDSEFYRNNITKIEHCEDQLILIEGSSPKRAGSLIVSRAWFQDDLLTCKLSGLELVLINKKRFQNYAIEDCHNCELYLNSGLPQVSKTGLYNVLIISETGAELSYDIWRILKRYGLRERDFNISSFLKCPLKSAKDITRGHIEKCKPWLEQEIQALNPPLVLAIGNNAVKFFTPEDTGINALAGTTAWNEKYGCYVAFCTSPSSLYYGGANIDMFEDSVKNFAENVKNLGLNDANKAYIE